MKKHLACAVCALAVLASQAFGAINTYSIGATNNATVQPAGPRPGGSGKAFFNIEGSANGSFASYGVARWDVSPVLAQFDIDFGVGSWTIEKIELELTQSNAAFSTTGDVRIHHTDDDAVNIEPGTSPLTYPFPGDFADAAAILTYTYTVGTTGDVNSYVLYDSSIVNSAGGLALLGDMNSEPDITLAFEDVDTFVAATYAGFTHSSLDGPTLVISASPEPGTIVLLALGALGFTRRRGSNKLA